MECDQKMNDLRDKHVREIEKLKRENVVLSCKVRFAKCNWYMQCLHYYCMFVLSSLILCVPMFIMVSITYS